MAIDRIGKGGGIPQAPETGATGKTGGTGATFKVDRPQHPESTTATARSAEVGATGASSPLTRLRAGEVDVHGYVDLKVDEATKGLHGVPPAQLAEIKKLLRDQMRTDPGLAELVRTATGQSPSPPED